MHEHIDLIDRHLLTRCQQRGIPKRHLETLLKTADRIVPVGRGCASLTLTRSGVDAMRAEGVDCSSLDQIARRAIIIDAVGTPITILIPSGKHRRRYRRGLAGHRRMRR
jgi:hypothetical protein